MPNPDENIGDVWAQTLSILEASPDITPRQIAFIRLAKPLAILDVTVRRNGYGRQRESFEAPLTVRDLAGGDFAGVFIRAPVVERVGPAIDVLARYEAAPVLGRQGRVWFSSFHPELSGDLRLHERFLQEVG